MNWHIQGQTGGDTTKREEGRGIIQVGDGEILGGQRPSPANGEQGEDLRDPEDVKPPGIWCPTSQMHEGGGSDF